jgi:16S rRNA (cytosine1402-N4)-methyltransferase
VEVAAFRPRSRSSRAGRDAHSGSALEFRVSNKPPAEGALDPGRYPEEVRKILASGKTPAGLHVPIMLAEVIECLQPAPGNVVVDCTLGGGGHARALLERIRPGGRLIGLDIDPIELPRTEAALRAVGFGPEVFSARLSNFAGFPQALAAEGLDAADILLADLGVSSMQFDDPSRGFSYKGAGPLDMRMNPSRGEPAWKLLARLDERPLAAILEENADEPHAALIARLLTQPPALETTQMTERRIRVGLTDAVPGITKPDIKRSIRRTFQALRIAVNDEFAALDALLRQLPHWLRPGGRAAIITFHSGEDRRVKKAFQAGHRSGIYAAIATNVIRPSKDETFANRRASSAKLRWTVRALTGSGD